MKLLCVISLQSICKQSSVHKLRDRLAHFTSHLMTLESHLQTQLLSFSLAKGKKHLNGCFKFAIEVDCFVILISSSLLPAISMFGGFVLPWSTCMPPLNGQLPRTSGRRLPVLPLPGVSVRVPAGERLKLDNLRVFNKQMYGQSSGEPQNMILR